MSALLSRLSNFIVGWRFAAFVISLSIAGAFISAGILLLPESAGPFGEAVTDFKTWCFGYNPESGDFRAGYLPVMLLNPIVLGGLIGLMWKDVLAEAFQRERARLFWTVGAGFLAGALLTFGAFAVNPGRPIPERLPFPGERIRSALKAPEFELIDQEKEPLSLADFQGEVVLLTAMYTECSTACPMIMVQARRAIAELPKVLRDEVTIVAVTLDPENDTPEKLLEASRSHQVSAPRWRLVTGPVDTVNRVLDQMSVSRQRNPQTDEIEHSNLFALIDRQGQIAYRLTLDLENEHWLSDALSELLREDPSGEDPGSELSSAE